MSNIADKDIDNLFREASDKYTAEFDEGAWADMEGQLNTRFDDGFGYYKILSGIILLFIVGAGIIWNQHRNVSETIIVEQREGREDSINTNLRVSALSLSVLPSGATLEIIGSAKSGKIEKGVLDVNQYPVEQNKASGLTKKSKDYTIQKSTMPGKKSEGYYDQGGPLSQQNKGLTQGEMVDTDIPDYLTGLGYNFYIPDLFRSDLKSIGEDKHTKEKEPERRVWALKIVFAPDLSSIGYFKPDKPGSNMGVEGEVFFGKRWSISSGIIYSQKIYSSEESTSYGYAASTSRVDANCRVLDIPVNLSFYLQQHENHSLYITTGLSSYLMLREDYNYEYEVKGKKQVWSQRLINKNDHYAGILNLSFGYEKYLKGNFYIQLEPFIKAPLRGIGEGKVDLVSSGAFLSVKYQFSK